VSSSILTFLPTDSPIPGDQSVRMGELQGRGSPDNGHPRCRGVWQRVLTRPARSKADLVALDETRKAKRKEKQSSRSAGRRTRHRNTIAWSWTRPLDYRRRASADAGCEAPAACQNDLNRTRSRLDDGAW